MKFLRVMAWTLCGLAAVALVSFLLAAQTYKDIPAAELEAKYGNQESRFMNVAGVRIHYRDEGPHDAPVVVLVHANFASLLGWESWAKALKDSYRVVRFDMTSHGLTGPDSTGDYTLERTMEITEKFIDAMGIDNFTIAGTSLGGTIAVLYHNRNPSRVERMILLSPGSLEGKEQKARGDVPDSAYILKYIMPRALPEFMLRSGFGDKAKLDNELIDRWYELWMRDGQREAQLDRLRQYDSGDIESVYRQLDVPVLLLWGEANTTAKFEQSEKVMRLLENAESIKFISYPGVGHMAAQEAGAEIAIDVREWLDAQTGAAALALDF